MKKFLKGNYLLYLGVAIILAVVLFSFRENLTNDNSITATGGHAYSDGNTITIEYTYSPSKFMNTYARAAIKKITYLGPSGQIGELSPSNTDRNVPPSSLGGDTKWIIPMPSGVTKPPLHSMHVTSYLYYVYNDSNNKPTGETSADIVTPILVS